MSHITQINPSERYDIPALKQMCENKGWEFIENQETYKWFGSIGKNDPMPEGFTKEELGKCHHAIRIPGAKYEIGVVNKNGKNQLLWDFWKYGGLSEKLGQNAGVLKQSYGIAKAQIACRQKGRSWSLDKAKEEGWQKLTVNMAF